MAFVKELFKKEPAVTIGFITGAADIAFEVATSNPHVPWRGLLPLIAAAIIRRYVTPAD